MPIAQSNYIRMRSLIDKVFAVRDYKEQIQVTPSQLKKLVKLHPATLTEFADENGPLIWILVIPTTTDVMNAFLNGKIVEKAILSKTKIGSSYECIYLCSATTLKEYRGKGETKKMCLKAIAAICKIHPVKTLFVWPFTPEGNILAETVSKASGLKLLKKENLVA